MPGPFFVSGPRSHHGAVVISARHVTMSDLSAGRSAARKPPVNGITGSEPAGVVCAALLLALALLIFRICASL